MRSLLLFLTIAGIGCCAYFSAPQPAPRASTALSQSAYVWQRSWNTAVRNSVQAHGAAFDRMVVLAAEITWKGSTPTIVRVKPDVAALSAIHRPIGLAIRSGLYHGTFHSDDPAAMAFTGLAAELLDEAKEGGITVSEVQLDFDCAESKLDGYCQWVTAVSKKIAPVPLTITALPCWLNQSAFRRLAASVPEYVLQVHAMERPDSMTAPCALCDPRKARAWIEHAAQCGVPFSVALPTYGYRLAFDAQGKFLGAGAEGPKVEWPLGTQFKDLCADASELALLVNALNESRPANLRGVIWYRLPCEVDTKNWRWSTLETVMAGRVPKAALEKSVRMRSRGLVEIELVNTGDADDADSKSIVLRFPEGARLLAADGLNEFEFQNTSPGTARLTGSAWPPRVWAGRPRSNLSVRISSPRSTCMSASKRQEKHRQSGPFERSRRKWWKLTIPTRSRRSPKTPSPAKS